MFSFFKKNYPIRETLKWPDENIGYFRVSNFLVVNERPSQTLDEYIASQRAYWGESNINSSGRFSWNGEDDWLKQTKQEYHEQHNVTENSHWNYFGIGDMVHISQQQNKDWHLISIVNNSRQERHWKWFHCRGAFYRAGSLNDYCGNFVTLRRLSRDFGPGEQYQRIIDAEESLEFSVRITDLNIHISGEFRYGLVVGIILTKT